MKRVTSTDAARQFSELINQVRYRGESFIITRNGEDICRLAPAERRLTLGELARLAATASVDPEFALDLEAIQRDQQPLTELPWES